MLERSLALTSWVVQLQERLAVAEQQASAAHFGTPAQTQIYRDLRQASIVYKMLICCSYSHLSNLHFSRTRFFFTPPADRHQAVAKVTG